MGIPSRRELEWGEYQRKWGLQREWRDPREEGSPERRGDLRKEMPGMP